MSSDKDQSDDDLIRRLQKASQPEATPTHDPFLDLPVATEVRVPGGRPPGTEQPLCKAPARRQRDVHGVQYVPVTEPIQCELPAGHSGAHRACFEQSWITRRWRALEWPASASTSTE
jgi:hypothetical protein